MSQNNISYPYPVLAPNTDDVNALIDTNGVQIERVGDCFEITVNLEISDENLLEYIKNDYLEYMVESDCSDTLYRRRIKQSDNKFKVTVPVKGVAGRVWFRPYLIAKKAFTYTNSNFHPDYGDDACFDIEEGDVIAIFKPFFYDFDIDYGNLRAFSSFMNIQEAEDPNQTEIKYLFDGEPKIVIVLPKDRFEEYKSFKGVPKASAAIHASLAQNALMAVLLQTDWSGDGSSDSEIWKKTIRKRVQEDFPDINLESKEDLILLSQRLLGDPMKRMFRDFEDLFNQ